MAKEMWPPMQRKRTAPGTGPRVSSEQQRWKANLSVIGAKGPRVRRLERDHKLKERRDP